MVEEEIKVGDRVMFTGHGYRRAITYGYAKLFGEKEHKVLEVRTSCCNRFIVLDDVDGMYSDKFFTKVPPVPPIPQNHGGRLQRVGGTPEPR